MNAAEWSVGLAAGLALAGGVLAVVGFGGILSLGLAESPAQDRLNRLCTAGAVMFVILGVLAVVLAIVAGGVGGWTWAIGGGTAILGGAAAVMAVVHVSNRYVPPEA